MALSPCQSAVALPTPLPGSRQEPSRVPSPQPRPMASLDAANVAVVLGHCHHLEEVFKGLADPIVLHKHHTGNGEGDGSIPPRVSVRGLWEKRGRSTDGYGHHFPMVGMGEPGSTD